MQGMWVCSPVGETKIPHAMEQLSPWAVTMSLGPTTRESVGHNEKIPYNAMKIEHALTKTQCNQINK